MLTKRQKIAISSLLLASGIFALPVMEGTNQVVLLSAIVTASYFLSVWSIYAEFSSFELISLFVLPVILTATFALFLSGFQVSIGVRLILALIYVAAMYTILLSENIFNVSVDRNIPLVRAARTVGYLATLFVSFAFFTLLFGLGLNNLLFAIVATLVSSLLFAQGFWQIELKETNPVRLVYFSLVGGLIVGEVAWALSFWPLQPSKVGLTAAAAVYVILGVLQHHIRENLTRRTLFEYIFVGMSLVLLLIISTSWGV
ncbi:MAG TPA: hypothetical protein VF303_00275 [Candidatus Nanoarchaeia archaeon]